MNLKRWLAAVAVASLSAALFVACKKKVPEPGTAKTAEPAKTAEVAVKCPKPGEDLICEDCKMLFVKDQDYADHMEKNHPEKWAKIKDQFWAARGGGTSAAPPK